MNSVEGEDKHGNRETLTTINPSGHFLPSVSLSAYSCLLLRLDSPFGSYQPCLIPLQHSSDSHSTVNYVVEATEEMEQRLEGVIHELSRNGSYRRLASVLLSQSIDVSIEAWSTEAKLCVQGGMTLHNHTHIPLLIRCWLGHVLVFVQTLSPHSSTITPPYASHLPYLQIQIQPLVCKAEEIEGYRLQSYNGRELHGFVFSCIEVMGTQLSSGVLHRCYRSDVRECDEMELCQDITELGIILSSSKQSHSRYEVSFSPVLSIRNCLPVPLALSCSTQSIPLPLFADTHPTQLTSLESYPFYDHWSDRILALAPAHMRCDTSLSIRTLAGVWNIWLEHNQIVTESEYSECNIECSDYDGNPLSLTCRCEWFNGGITINVCVPFWFQIESDLPLLFHCFTNKEKETEVCNQHFEQSKKLLLLDSTHPFLTISTPTSNASPPIPLRSLSQANQTRSVTLTDRWRFGHPLRHSHSLLITSVSAPPSVPMTHILLLTSRIQILNNTTLHLEILQEGAPDSESLILPSHALIPLSLIHGCPQSFRLRLLNGSGVWSTSLIHLSDIRRSSSHDKLLYVRTLTNEMEFLLVHVNSRNSGTLDIVIDHSKYGGTDLPVVIVNQTLYPLRVKQHAVPQADMWFIAPYSSSSFFWADADWKHVIDVDVFPPHSRGNGAYQSHLKLDCTTSRTRIHLHVHDSEHDQILAGSIEVLRSVVFVNLKYLPVEDSKHTQTLLSSETTVSRPLRLELHIPAVHITLLTAQGCDLICVSGTQLCLRVCRNRQTDFQLSLTSLEVSNQLLEAKYPKVLVMKSTVSTEEQAKPRCLILRCTVCEGNSVDYGHCILLSNVECDLAPITLILERCLLNHLTRLQSVSHVLSETEFVRQQLPTSIPAYLQALHEYSVKWYENHYPVQPRASPDSVMRSRSQLYEESRHIRLQRLRISSISITLSLAFIPTQISTCQLFTLDSLCVSLHPITIAETYPRRISHVRNLLIHSYMRALFIQFPVLCLSLRSLGAPATFVHTLLNNIKRFAVDLVRASNQPSLFARLQHTVEAITCYLDHNFVNLTIVVLNVVTSWLESLTMVFSVMHSSIQSRLLHGSISSFSPFIPSSHRGYSLKPILHQTQRFLLRLIFPFTRLTLPLQKLLTNLQSIRSVLEGSSSSYLRSRAPNVSVSGIVLPYDAIYSRGREMMMCVRDGKYSNEDCLAVYSISQACLVITRTYLLLMRTKQNRIELMCEVVFDDCVSLKSTCLGDNRYSLEFLCFQNVDLFDHSSTQLGVLFACRLEKRSVYIGKGNAAKQVCEKVEEIILNEVKNHDYGKC